ncbi:MAG TPA: FAD-binding oxidoreductase [candidate division Zixibacteria bacterium]|nr:FAD-binding oxidoreductase [candidate division Zixibacteria bacterium]
MKFDVIIIGAGVIGASTAYHLQKNALKKKILLIEKNDRVAIGNTAKSAALYRNLFSSKTSQILSKCSIAYYETIAEKIALNNIGYFWMFSKESWKKSQKGLEKLDNQKDNFKILSRNEIPENLQINIESSEEFKELDHILCGYRCGSLSAIKLANHYAEEFQKIGGTIQFNTEIKKVNLSNKEQFYPPWKDVKIISIKDNFGKEYSAEDSYIFTTGAWMNELLTPIGVASHIYPQKRQIFTLKLADATQIASDPKEKIPILILPTGGVYVKPLLQNKLLVVGCANELGNPFMMENYPPDAEEGYFREVIEPVLRHYFPKLKDYKLFSKWAGYYAYYWPDKNPIIEKVSNIQWVSGTSGSGIMKADAIGRIAAAKSLDNKKVELFDSIIFNPENLSLKHRKVDSEELII